MFSNVNLPSFSIQYDSRKKFVLGETLTKNDPLIHPTPNQHYMEYTWYHRPWKLRSRWLGIFDLDKIKKDHHNEYEHSSVYY